MNKVNIGDVVYEASSFTWGDKIIVTKENLEEVNEYLNIIYYTDYNRCIEKCHLLHSDYQSWVDYNFH